MAGILSAEGLEFEVVSLADFPQVTLPAETGRTFAENAILKAAYAAEATRLPAVADDSGLEVDALEGEPGIRSARYVAEDAADEDRCEKVLGLLRAVPDDSRTARFRCAAAYAEPSGATLLAEGTCEGRIARQPRGSGGFGYDPIFVPEGETRTMAQLSPDQKHAISHRGRAFRELARLLRERLAQENG
jgi:XTP/dITP diphosphohydrolase